MISSGRLRQILEFYFVSYDKNDYNESVKTLIYQFRTRGEQIQSETETGVNSDGTDISGVARFKVRYTRNIKTKMVVRFNGEDFEITNVENAFGRNREMLIDAINYIQD